MTAAASCLTNKLQTDVPRYCFSYGGLEGGSKEYNLECFGWLEKMLIRNHDQKGRQENYFFSNIPDVYSERHSANPQRIRLNDHQYFIQMLIKYLLPFLF